MRRKNAPNLTFDKLEHESVAELAISQIEELILTGVLREGDLLPSERDLAEQFGISRPKVREALQALSERDLIRIKGNDGVYIARLSGEAMSPALIDLYSRSASAIRDNLEYRREQEGFASRLAAQRATDRDRSELQAILSEMETTEGSNAAKQSELDLRLHQTIAFAAHNSTLTHMITALYTLNRTSLFYNREELLNLASVGTQLFEQHSQIVNAICKGRDAEAEAAAKSHIDYVAELVDTAFNQNAREHLSVKRYGNKTQPS